MARIIAPRITSLRAVTRIEMLRTLIVCGCALALIAVRHPLPF